MKFVLIWKNFQQNLILSTFHSAHAVISLAISLLGVCLALFWKSDTDCKEYFFILYIRCIYWVLTFVCRTLYLNIISFISVFYVNNTCYLFNIFSYTIMLWNIIMNNYEWMDIMNSIELHYITKALYYT